MMGYCVKCREMRPMKDPWTIMNKRNVPMKQAKCGVCTRLVNTFVKRDPNAPKIVGTFRDGPAPPPGHSTKVDEGVPKRKDAPLLPRKREPKKRKGKARRALQESLGDLRQDESVRDEDEGE
jgi:hypothetical protein